MEAAFKHMRARLITAAALLIAGCDTPFSLPPPYVPPPEAYRAWIEEPGTLESVASHGDDILIGSTAAVGSEGTGHVSVFSRSLSPSKRGEFLLPQTASPKFGSAIVVTDSRVLVASPEAGRSSGSVQIFSPSYEWIEELAAPASDEGFATSIAAAAGWIAVGAPAKGRGASREGAVYLFEKVPQGQWTRTELPASPSDGSFGQALAMSNDWIAVGAPYSLCEDDPSALCGSVTLFERTDAGWERRQTVTGSSPQGSFGSAVAIAGDVLVVGAPLEQIKADFNIGAAYIFALEGDRWEPSLKLTGSDPFGDGWFGAEVFVSAEAGMLAVGAIATPWTLNSDGMQGGGAVYLSDLQGMPLSTKITPSFVSGGAQFGAAIWLDKEILVSLAPFGANALDRDETGAFAVYKIEDVLLPQ